MKFIEIHFYCSLPLFFKKVSVLYTVFIVKSKGPLTLLLLASVKFRGGGATYFRYNCTIYSILMKYMYMYYITNTQSTSAYIVTLKGNCTWAHILF